MKIKELKNMLNRTDEFDDFEIEVHEKGSVYNTKLKGTLWHPYDKKKDRKIYTFIVQ
jgi:hypothetical protein